MCSAAVSTNCACFGTVLKFEGMFQFSLFAAYTTFLFADAFERFVFMRQGSLFTANGANLFAVSFDRFELMFFSRLPAAGALFYALAR